MYLRLNTDHAAPVLSFVGKGGTRKLEVKQNEAVRVLLGSPRDARVVSMRTELGLQSIEQRVKEINLVGDIRFMRSNSGVKFVKDMQGGMEN